jgi:hypothetical protein
MTNLGSTKLEKDGKRFQDDVAALKTAIEEAINKGQKSVDGLSNVRRSGLVSHKDFALPRTNSGSRTVARLADF